MENQSLTKMAVMATAHCLLGCAIGEVLGMMMGAALDLSAIVSVVLSITLAFVFGYGLSLRSVLAGGLPFGQAWKVVFAADTVSITSMEIVDNAVILVVPGAIAATLTDVLFWASLGFSLAIAFVVTVPVNRWLIARGKGHAVMHTQHGHHR